MANQVSRMCLSKANKDPLVFKAYKEDTFQNLPLSCQHWQEETWQNSIIFGNQTQCLQKYYKPRIPCSKTPYHICGEVESVSLQHRRYLLQLCTKSIPLRLLETCLPHFQWKPRHLHILWTSGNLENLCPKTSAQISVHKADILLRQGRYSGLDSDTQIYVSEVESHCRCLSHKICICRPQPMGKERSATRRLFGSLD